MVGDQKFFTNYVESFAVIYTVKIIIFSLYQINKKLISICDYSNSQPYWKCGCISDTFQKTI
jgi:hypothetical protein